VFMQLEWSD